MFNIVNKKNIVIVILLIIFLLGTYFLRVQSNGVSANTKTIEEICGDYPLGFVKIDIETKPNYIFTNDPEFPTKKLFDIEGNTVLVNSFIECEHYTSGGWNYSPQVNDTIERENCEELEDLQSTSLSNIRFAFNDIKLNQFYKDYGINCIGKLKSKFYSNEQEFYEVYYSRSLYVVISQLLPLGILIFSTVKIINKNFLFFCLFALLIYSQVIFSYNYSLNTLNNVSFFSGLMLLLHFFIPKDEFNANKLIPKMKFPTIKKILKRIFNILKKCLLNEKNSLLYFIPFLVAIYDYDYFPFLAVISISIIYLTNNEITLKKSWLRFSFFSFLLVRLLSAINLTFTDTWLRISQKNYSLDYRFIDMQEAFMSLYCSQSNVGDTFLIYGSSRSMTCPYNISYGPFFEFINLKVNPWTATLTTSILIFILIFLFYNSLLKNESSKNSYLVTIFFFSPSLNFVLERMNLDIFIVIVLVISYRYIKNEYVRNLVIFMLALIKYYPAFIFISNIAQKLISKKLKTIKIDLAFISIFIGTILLSFLYFGIEFKQPIRPIRSDRTFGLLSEAQNLQHAFNVNTIYGYFFLFLLLIYIIFLINKSFIYSRLYESNIDFTFINMFLALSFFANYDYRLIILLVPIKAILNSKNRLLLFSYSLFVFSSPGLLYSYQNHFYLVEDYFFVYIDIPFYFLLSILIVEYINFIKIKTSSSN